MNCSATHPHDDAPCILAEEHPPARGRRRARHYHRDRAGRWWRDDHACTMCPVRDAHGRIVRHDPHGDVPL